MVDFMRDVETSYDLPSISADGVQVWPFLRQIYFSHYARKIMPGLTFKGTSTKRWRELGRVRNILHGAGEWRRRHEYVVISSTWRRRLIDGRYVDKSAEWLMRELGKDNVLMVEMAMNPGGGDFRTMSTSAGDTVVSSDLLSFLALLPGLGIRPRIEHEEILDEINRKYELRVRYRWAVASFLRMRRVFRRLFMRWQPRCVFFSAAYYGVLSQPAIAAAAQLGIPTVELQHGFISDEHEAYMVHRQLDRAAFPDYLFCYGDYVKQYFGARNHYIPVSRVHTVGSGYIEYIRDEYECDEALRDCLAQFDRSVTVSSILTAEEEIIELMCDAARRDPRILYVFVPREWEKDYAGMGFPPNVKLFRNLDFYRIAKFTDFHSTVSSTCALEAPAFGTPNILLDIKGLARSYYGSMLTDGEVTRYVTTGAEFADAIRTWQPRDRQDIIERHREFYLPGHRAAVREAVARVLTGGR